VEVRRSKPDKINQREGGAPMNRKHPVTAKQSLLARMTTMSIRTVHNWINTLSSPRFYCRTNERNGILFHFRESDDNKRFIAYNFVCCRKRGFTSIFNRFRKIVVTIASVIFVCFLLVSCGGKGEFAFKSFEMDTYRTMKSGMEFPSDSKTDWLYKIPSVSGKKRYGIIMLKKELVWAEIAKEVQEAEKEKPYLWGSIHGLDPGLYKIMITKDNKLVDENEFVVFDPRTEGDDDDD
jgi:hypothetical protein